MAPPPLSFLTPPSYLFQKRTVRSPYFAKRRARAAPKWRTAALAAEQHALRQPWESEAAFARRVSARATVPLAAVRPLPDANAFIGVYLLQSSVQPSRVYVGFTTDVERRLKKHNGLIAGGARYTTTGRPWRLVMHVNGFPSKVEALRFESALIHYQRSRHVRPLLSHAVVRAVDPLHNRIGMLSRLYQLLTFAPHFCEMPLRITWVCADARARNEIEFGDSE
jgi:predicted GIY-YIG superfamily endonuclease